MQHKYIICLMADLCFHCFSSQQAPRGGPGLPAGNQVEEKAKQSLERNNQVLWALLSLQGSAPRLSSLLSPFASPFASLSMSLSASLSTSPPASPSASPSPSDKPSPPWLGRGDNAPTPEVCLWVFLDADRRCLCRRTHWIPFLKKALHSLSRIW